MDSEYAAKLAGCYKRLHTMLQVFDRENISWPVCTDPGKRHKEFLEFLESYKEEEWAQYYRDVSVSLEKLVWLNIPKDNPSP